VDAKRDELTARLALAFAVACVSSGAIFARLAACPALAIAAWRMTFATALVSLALVRWWPELRTLTRRDFALGGAAGLCLAIHFATWISSLDYTTVASSTVLVNTAPLWVALLSPFITRERTNCRAWMGIGLSFVGSAIIAGSDFRMGGKALLGDLLALAGGLAAALYLLFGRQLRTHLSLPNYCVLTYGVAMAVLWIIVAVAGVQASGFAAKTWGAIAGMAVVAQIGGHTLYNWSLKHLPTGAVAVALLGEPIGSSLLAWRLFGEVPPPASLGGAGLVLAGIYLAAASRK
jgi:drug/metabolite transporter (DMT)-like permease